MEELDNLYHNGVKYIEPSDLSGSLKGRQNMYNHLDMMLKNASSDAVIVTSADGLNRKMEALMPAFEKAKKRGVKVRIVAPINESNYKVAKELSKYAEVRSVDGKSQGRFALVDGKELMFMLLDDKSVHPSYDTAVWLSSDYLANSMKDMFEKNWNEFTPLNRLKVK